ncbi:PTS sugar transporter subunit IIA [Sebaldella sp. S0638]|uniref:PTS sugar transporter subunit IIA n=1 Tax=Sebaldella sp. S0638 TaxID=2957809 RepID=UPI00209CD99B|nr:PTS sugar transporter subunit IIA [Sebaldella sp. S0638]MCP1225393.1 PTS sugar transporter subunit IIA [Sebaldella sp. S0638]
MREIDKDLIFINMNFENKSELFKFVAEELKKRDYVEDTYEAAINERESRFPTGFQLKNMNIAMPHADPVNSRADKLIILTLEKPVEFQNAEDKGSLNVSIVFGLVFHNRDKHIDYLMRLSNLIQDSEKLEKIKKAGTKEEIYDLLNEIFK